MRIHLQSHDSKANFPLTPTLWAEACARAGEVASGLQPSFGITPEEFAAGMQDAEILIGQTSAMVGGMPAAPKVKMVFVTSAGLEKLAPFDWLPPGVALLNNRGTHADKIGEFGLMALLMLANQMPALADAQRAGRWTPIHSPVIAGRTVVVVGLGTLGGAIAAQAQRLGMKVTGVRTRAEPHPACETVVAVAALDEVLPRAEFLVLATPLTPATKGLLSRARLALLPQGAGLVNVGRGGLVDQDAVLDALDSGQLGGAVLDVFVPEPLPDGHRVWTTRNLVVTPHISADDPNTYNPRTLDIFFENLRAYRQGAPLPNLYDLARGY